MNEDPHRDGPVLQVGAPLETAAGAVILLHGRGASAEGTQSLAAHFDLPQPLFAKGMLLDRSSAARAPKGTSDMNVLDNGLVHLSSPHSVPDTVAALEEVVRSRSIPILAKIDHSSDAAKVGLQMPPTVLLIFGNALAGTPVMLAAPSAAIDLPLKALAWQDAEGRVWLSYNSPAYLQQRHGIPDSLLKNIAGIAAICEAAVR